MELGPKNRNNVTLAESPRRGVLDDAVAGAVADFSRQVELALFYDAKLDLAV
jgi:hypothetical protein